MAKSKLQHQTADLVPWEPDTSVLHGKIWEASRMLEQYTRLVNPEPPNYYTITQHTKHIINNMINNCYD